MEAFQRYILALFVLTGSLEVLGQVSSLCRPNENYLNCGGCQRTCENPSPACAAICRVGCYCPGDLVRGKDGVCIPLSECPTTALYHDDSNEPRNHDLQCPADEEYRFCEPCNKTCDNPNPVCPAQCARGCFCKDDLVRDKDGKCVPVRQCGIDKQSNFVKRESLPVCGYGEEFRTCPTCERSCSDPEPACAAHAQCEHGCYCRKGLVRSPAGSCVELEQCPKAYESPDLLDTTVEDCTEDEEWLGCGWCEPTCSDPEPSCPPGCLRGCLCRPPLLRHQSGRCVRPESCEPRNCTAANTEYACPFTCEENCSRKPCRPRVIRCTLGCYCRAGYLREDSTGECVAPQHCTTGAGDH